MNSNNLPPDDMNVLPALLRSKTLPLRNYGITYRKREYLSSNLAALFHRGIDTVEVRYYANDDNHLEVFCDGAWVCTATRTDRPSASQMADWASRL